MSSLLVRTMVLVWTFPARRVTTVAQIYGWTPRRGGRQWRRGTASPVQDHLVMVYIGAGHPAPAKNRASMSARRSPTGELSELSDVTEAIPAQQPPRSRPVRPARHVHLSSPSSVTTRTGPGGHLRR